MPYRCHLVAAKSSKFALFCVFICYHESWPKMVVSPMKQTVLEASWRGGRAVDCAGLENRKAERPREFESHPLRIDVRYSMFDVRCLPRNRRVTNQAQRMPSTAAHTTSDR